MDLIRNSRLSPDWMVRARVMYWTQSASFWAFPIWDRFVQFSIFPASFVYIDRRMINNEWIRSVLRRYKNWYSKAVKPALLRLPLPFSSTTPIHDSVPLATRNAEKYQLRGRWWSAAAKTSISSTAKRFWIKRSPISSVRCSWTSTIPIF